MKRRTGFTLFFAALALLVCTLPAAASQNAVIMVAKKTRELIGRFGVDRSGAPLFFPDAGKKPESPGL